MVKKYFKIKWIASFFAGEAIATWLGPTIASGITAMMGWFSELPLVWIFVAVVIVANQTMGVIKKMDTPTGRKKQKIDALYSLCGNMYVITDESLWGTPQAYPFTESLKQAEVAFSDCQEFMDIIEKMRRNRNSNTLFFPDLVVVMGREVGIELDSKNFEIAYTLRSSKK